MYRDWPPPPDGRNWTRRPVSEATLAGAAVLAATQSAPGAPTL
jgi:hypothetical protein